VTERKTSGDTMPYGPNTAAVRDFLRRLADRPGSEWVRAMQTYDRLQATLPFRGADRALGDAIEAGMRNGARDAVVGPIVQLARSKAPDGVDAELLAESALGAALALVARDMLSAETFATLYGPFAPILPLAAVSPDEATDRRTPT
jgi:hypothetical protein